MAELHPLCMGWSEPLTNWDDPPSTVLKVYLNELIDWQEDFFCPANCLWDGENLPRVQQAEPQPFYLKVCFWTISTRYSSRLWLPLCSGVHFPAFFWWPQSLPCTSQFSFCWPRLSGEAFGQAHGSLWCNFSLGSWLQWPWSCAKAFQRCVSTTTGQVKNIFPHDGFMVVVS